MAKTKKQQELTNQVQQRLTESGPVRVDASAVKSGGERGHTLRVNEIHPSLEGGVERMSGLGISSGTITTADGLNVQVTKGPRSQSYVPHGQGMTEQKKGVTLPPGPQEGVSPRFEQRIGYEHGPEAAAKHVAEAEKIAARPNPLRSDGLVDAVMAMHSPSVGGNRLGRGGAMSSLAKMDDQFKPSSKVARQPAPADGPSVLKQDAYATSGKELALHTLGYTPSVQQTMFGTARDRIARRSSNSRNPLSPAEISGRAYAQVNEHLDEAIHGTRKVGHESALINDAIQNAGGSVETATSPGSPRPQKKAKGGGLGMTASRTPEQRAQRATVRDLTRGGKWNALRDADALDAAVKNDVDLMTAKQKARRAGGKHPEEFNTMSPGADVEAAGRRHAQPVFSTSNPGVGTPSEGPNSKVLPPTARKGAVSPIPPNLPTEAAKIGRSREERGFKPSSFPTGSEPVVAAKPGKVAPKKKVAAGGGGGAGLPDDWNRASNVKVAQTAPFGGTGIQSGLTQARQINPALGQRGASGARMGYKPTP